MPVRKRHVQRRIVEQVLGTPWQILPEKMDEIADLLDLRQAGYELTDEEVAAVMPVQQEKREDVLVSGNTAVVKVYGTLFQRANLLTRYSGGTSTEQLQTNLTRAANDPNISRIILDIDSPGGTALGNEEVVQKIREIRKVKPVIASVNGLAASAAYYIASAAEKVYASPSSMVGSIGTLLIHRESSKADAEAGIKFTILRSGKFKADGNEREPLGEQGRATLEERVVVYHDQFVEAVATSRNVTEAVVRDQFGDGKVFIASEALKRNMIDEIATLEQLLNRRYGHEAKSRFVRSGNHLFDGRERRSLRSISERLVCLSSTRETDRSGRDSRSSQQRLPRGRSARGSSAREHACTCLRAGAGTRSCSAGNARPDSCCRTISSRRDSKRCCIAGWGS